MTPQELTDDLKASGIKEFGLDASQSGQVFPSKYFDWTVKVIAPDGSEQSRDPGHCATEVGASALSFLNPDSIALGNAANFDGLLDGWGDSRLVPYLQFGSKNINAGLLLQYFNHGYPAEVALKNALSEIAG